MEAYSDEQMMDKVAQGETRLLGILFERHYRALYNYYLRWLGRPELAEDLVQDTFFRMLKYGSSYKQEVPFRAWMFTIAHRVGCDALSSFKSETAMPEGFDPVGLEDPDRQLDAKRKVQQLNGILGSMQVEKREILILSRFHNLKYKDIASMMNCSVTAVKVRVHRALTELKTKYRGKEAVGS